MKTAEEIHIHENIDGNGLISSSEIIAVSLSNAMKSVIDKTLTQFGVNANVVMHSKDEIKRVLDAFAKQESEKAVREFKEELEQFLYSEITERRDYSASKMCEIIIEKLK